ncbi:MULTISPECIES: hypothetical protein [Pseudomonas]|uniref:hypothetical protein n=1 Tax=Pseudomonas nitroreducens TaxID=46680 RepID=UPI001E2ECD6D|nr:MULTISPECIES: hypothetical protein [Pseudomonas]MCE4069656.1 hypothetical protein [Pseudomonas nitritireducens]MCE4079181.1 hypothetical protein [Pseudomonas nitroreducens]
MTKQYTYGDSAIEFFPHDDNELQELIQKAENNYYSSIRSPIEVDKLSANISFTKGPLTAALPELIQLVQDGYTIRTDKYIGMQGGLLDVTLSIPQAQIDKDLIAVHADATEAYEADRYKRNQTETEYQISVTLARAARDEEKKQAAAAERAAHKARQQALDDLRQAYAA